MSNVKYQHYLARHHMSWFANNDGTNSFWLVNEERMLEKQNLGAIGGQKYLYESNDLPKNFIETKILGRVEDEFFAARNRAILDRAVRNREDRRAVRRYLAAQLLRQGHIHSRLVQMEQDLIFIAKEMGIERVWKTDALTPDGRRRRASSVMANTLFDLDDAVKLIENHLVTFVERPQNDLLLPDRGFVQVYYEDDEVRMDGLKSADFKALIPIAPNAALKLVPRLRDRGFSSRTRMGDRGHRVFMQNLGLNAKTFVAGTRDVITATNFREIPYFDPTAERLSMILQLYKAGSLDEMVADFYTQAKLDVPFDFVRRWFYESKFVPAVNKLFNPDENPNALVFGLPL